MKTEQYRRSQHELKQFHKIITEQTTLYNKSAIIKALGNVYYWYFKTELDLQPGSQTYLANLWPSASTTFALTTYDKFDYKGQNWINLIQKKKG